MHRHSLISNFYLFKKVYNRASCSLSWLERHILSHGGNRPFKCIVDNCCLRFPTQAALQRHVNSHFESSQGVKPSKFRDDTFPKSFKRKKHLKYKKRSASGKYYHIYIYMGWVLVIHLIFL